MQFMFVSLSWLEIKHKTRHCQGENSSIFIRKCIGKNLLKGKYWTCRWEKMNRRDEKH